MLMPIQLLEHIARKDPDLTEVNLSRPSFGWQISEIRKLADALQGNTHVKKLILSDCQLDDQAMQILVSILPTTGITHLDLTDNKLTDKSARALFEMPSLLSLRLGGNEIKGEALKIMPTNNTLRTLVLDGNPMTEKMLSYFLANHAVTTLILDEDDMDAELYQDIQKQITANALPYIQQALARQLPTAFQDIPVETLQKLQSQIVQAVQDYLHEQTRAHSTSFVPKQSGRA